MEENQTQESTSNGNKNCKRKSMREPQIGKGGSLKTRSLVWDHFTRLKANNDRAACNRCGKEYAANSRTNGTSSMRAHLENQCPFRLSGKNFRLPGKKQKILTWETKNEANGDGISTGILKAV